MYPLKRFLFACIFYCFCFSRLALQLQLCHRHLVKGEYYISTRPLAAKDIIALTQKSVALKSFFQLMTFYIYPSQLVKFSKPFHQRLSISLEPKPTLTALLLSLLLRSKPAPIGSAPAKLSAAPVCHNKIASHGPLLISRLKYVWPTSNKESVNNAVVTKTTAIYNHLRKQIVSSVYSLAQCQIKQGFCRTGTKVHFWIVPRSLNCPRVKKLKTVQNSSVQFSSVQFSFISAPPHNKNATII